MRLPVVADALRDPRRNPGFASPVTAAVAALDARKTAGHGCTVCAYWTAACRGAGKAFSEAVQVSDIEWTAYCAKGHALAAQVNLAFTEEGRNVIAVKESPAITPPDIILINEKRMEEVLREPVKIEYHTERSDLLSSWRIGSMLNSPSSLTLLTGI